MNNSIFEKSVYKGDPRPEQTAAWAEYHDCEVSFWADASKVKILILCLVQLITIDEADLKAINRSSIPVPDGSGYLAMLDVFHEIHCLYAVML